MREIDEQFHSARRDMLDAFVTLSTLARELGATSEALTYLHGQFFDGNVGIKDAYSVASFLAGL